MKILFIGRFNENDEELIAQAFEEEGVTVVRIEEKGTSSDMLSKVVAEKPDLVLFTKLNIQNPLVFIEKCRELKVPTASWTFDLLLGHPLREQMMDRFHWLKADYVFLTDGGHTYGENKFTVRQGIPKKFNYISQVEKTKDIVFVGSLNPSFPYRTKTIKFLQGKYNLEWYGMHDTEEIRGDKLNDLYASAKIVLGCSMPSPRYWSNRLYEITGRGGFTIFPYTEGIDQEFPDLVTYTFGDYEDLCSKIDYFLAQDREREENAMINYLRCSERYTFNQRVRELLSYVKTS